MYCQQMDEHARISKVIKVYLIKLQPNCIIMSTDLDCIIATFHQENNNGGSTATS